MISVEGLTVEFGGFTLFDDVSFVVNKKDRIALVGKNGAGKSTMLKIFAGLQSPTSGTVSVPKETTIGYLPQQMKLADTQTVREEAEHAFEHIHEMEKEIERLNQQLAERTDYETESYQNLIDRVTHLTEHFQMMGGNNYHAELERTLIGLGFSREDFDRPTSEFSGGWRMRIELAKLLLRKPDVLLLDEPINGLDPEGIVEFRNLLLRLNQERQTTILISSHILSELANLATCYGFLDNGMMLEQISARALEEKCRACIEARVDDASRAALVLEQSLGIRDYEVLPGHLLRIYSSLDAPHRVAQALVEGGVALQSIESRGANLEDYFLSMIGGVRHA